MARPAARHGRHSRSVASIEQALHGRRKAWRDAFRTGSPKTMNKARLEKHRILLTWIAAAIGFFLWVASENCWETRSKAIPLCLFSLGIVLVGIASMGRMWCSLYIAGYKNGRLVTEGPYSMCRNPLYFFSMLGVLGIGCCTEMLTFPLLFGSAFAVFYPSVIRSEEKRLEELFGAEFQNYKEGVPAFFPRFSAFREPETYSVRPAAYRKAMFDALWFVWMAGILEVVEGLKELGLSACMWSVY